MPVATKLGRVVKSNEEFPSWNLHNSLITWSFKVTWNIGSVTFLPQQGLWPPNLGRCLLTKGSFQPQSYTTFPSIISVDPLITWFCKVTRQIKCVISTNTRTLAINLGKVVSCYKGLPPIKLENILNSWSFEIMWHIENILSPLLQCLKPPKFIVWWSWARDYCHNVKWSFKQVLIWGNVTN